ncbi:MAG: D-alanyl-D-alanine carboxypeptidase [Lachnospiraceae bacterium]|nr:D-alanyl-D-alanine carboxypeptidase [Lachnospiraceae bacterium]HCJ08160.1 D-alanyl-D-alanine carboxypeptidase [Lachnospiraceae bacterium]
MKKKLAIFLALLLSLTICLPVSATEVTEEVSTEHPETTEYPDDPTRAPDLVANAAIVMDAASGQVLYEKNSQEKKYPASITKILTVLIALEHNVDFNATVTMSENAIWGVERDSTLIGLDVGEQVTVKDLVYATMVKSANECAYALAEYVAGDIESFAKLMNERAAEIGCKNTHFVTPNGLHDEDHYTTAYDMALITKEALKNETFREIAGTLNYTVPATNLTEETRPLWNGNKMINPAEPYYYEYCEGGKTGYTMKANNTLMTFAKKDGLELICVIMDCDGAKYAYSDSKALYNYCFNNYTYYRPLADFSFESEESGTSTDNAILNNYYTSLDHDMIDLSVDTDYALLLNKSVDTTQIERNVTFYDKAQDDVLGEITFTYNGEQIGSTPITSTTPLLSTQMAQDDNSKQSSSMWKTIGKIALRIGIVIGALLAVLLLYLLFAALVRKIKRNRRRRTYRRRRKRDDDYYF